VKTPPPRLSVVIPAFNEEALLPRTLAALGEALAAFRPGWETEVIVCDNNSTDGTAAVARAHGATVVFEPHNQIARARNAGAAAATGGWLLFLDADSVPTPALLAEARRAAEDPAILYAGAFVQMDGELPWGAALLVRGWNALSRTLRWMAGSFVLVRAEAFRAVGGFDTGLYAAEEIDLSRRLKRLARARGRRVAILRTPLVSSARKLRLYRQREILRFMLRGVLRPRATVTSREACAIWYDGRR
jgi:glycosyltransferase involved in cell wall biosynthesis